MKRQRLSLFTACQDFEGSTSGKVFFDPWFLPLNDLATVLYQPNISTVRRFIEKYIRQPHNNAT